MNGILAVLWREYLYFKKRIWSITGSSLVAPLLYLTAFGWGLGRAVNMAGVAYIDFIVPGILALSTMNASFNAVSTPLSIARLYDKTLEEYLVSPITLYSFAAGKILAGALRGMYVGLLLLAVAFVLGANCKLSGLFLLLAFLNCLVFASLGYLVALKIQSHPDMTRFNSFVITPMIFLCGTFFAPEHTPAPLQLLIKALPLTPASQGLRSLALGQELSWYAPALQLLYLVVFIVWGLRASHKVE
ncbi:ABC transporter permease [Desulforamulus putei]|uniref:Transport permease protein n=1 Tax=Desulforamulus putei DSM 12395 TaxID=1121429 RepID=A0A1M4TVN6_9FIRM|nr:ABC transporter permease [Desulforamulus putei]SHE48367.1 ABC-2 type transporter, NodJ family [Desulforamulus putei DSM 12395]